MDFQYLCAAICFIGIIVIAIGVGLALEAARRVEGAVNDMEAYGWEDYQRDKKKEQNNE